MLDERRVVLGKVLARSVDGAPDDDEVRGHLVEGPTTVRANEDVAALTDRMTRAGTSTVVVTTAEGWLLGVLFREDAERWVEEHHAGHEHEHAH